MQVNLFFNPVRHGQFLTPFPHKSTPYATLSLFLPSNLQPLKEKSYSICRIALATRTRMLSKGIIDFSRTSTGAVDGARCPALGVPCPAWSTATAVVEKGVCDNVFFFRLFQGVIYDYCDDWYAE
jgi:hypothetical protein